MERIVIVQSAQPQQQQVEPVFSTQQAVVVTPRAVVPCANGQYMLIL